MRWLLWDTAVDRRERDESSAEMTQRLEQLTGQLERATLDLRAATAGLRKQRRDNG